MKRLSRPSHVPACTLLAALCVSPLGLLSSGRAATPEESVPAKIVVTNNVVAANPEPFGMNNLNSRWAYNDLTGGSSEPAFEGMWRRSRFFATSVGTENGLQWFSNDVFNNTDQGDGYWTGATAYVYRRVVQPDGVATYQNVGTGTVQQGKIGRSFWEVSFGTNDALNQATRTRAGKVEEISFSRVIRTRSGTTSYDYTDGRINGFYNQDDLVNGQTYYYTVRAIDSGGNWSANSTAASATPLASLSNGPRITSHQFWNTGNDRIEAGTTAGTSGGTKLLLESTGGVGALTWTLDPATPLPTNLEFGSEVAGERSRAWVRLKANATATATDAAQRELRVTVTDANGQSDSRHVLLNPIAPTLDPNGLDTTAPAAPTNVSATALNGAVRITWTASTSTDVVGYAVLRSRFPANDQNNRIIMAAGAPALQVHDLVFLEKDFSHVYANTALRHERVRFEAFRSSNTDLNWRTSPTGSWLNWSSGRIQGFPSSVEYSHVAHPGTKPADFAPVAGDRCARVAIPANWQVRTGLAKINADLDYRMMEVGKTYRLRLWVRQSGVLNNTLKLSVPVPNVTGSTLSQVIPANTWTRMEMFMTPTGPDTSSSVELVRLEFGADAQTAAVVHYDAFDFCEVNATTNEPVVPLYTMLPYWKQELAEFFQTRPGYTGPKPTLRYWGLQSNGAGGVPFDAQLQSLVVRKDSGSQDPLSLPDYLALCKEVGAEPWIIMSVSHLEGGYAALLEYLAGPDSTYYGNLRKQHRGGNATPWTDEFPRIHWECDNESWNDMFGWVFNGRADEDSAAGYAEFTEMLFRHVKSRPLWNSTLASKIIFVGNGFNAQPEYGRKVGALSPSTEMIDVAPYLGGWESGTYIGGSAVTDTGFSRWLVYAPWRHFDQVAEHVTRRNTVNTARAAAGIAPYVLGVYEGGPGYTLPGPGSPPPVVDETYGKSLAAAITTLDCYLHESYRGYGQQTYFGFTVGSRWASHAHNPTYGTYLSGGVTKQAPITNSYIRHNNYLAMYLRNRHASGGMVQTYATSMPSRDLPAEAKAAAQNDVPLVATYAFKDGNRYALIVMSRRIDERDANGNVVDPAITPVTLQLPFTSAGTITLHRIYNDPRASNVPGLATYDPEAPLEIESLVLASNLVSGSGEFVIDTGSGGVASADGYREGLPPGSIYVYVFEGTTSATLPVVPVASIARASTQTAATFKPAMDYLLTFDRPITGLTAADISLANSTATVSGASVTVEPLDALLLDAAGNNISLVWKVSVTGVSGSGYVQVDLLSNAVAALSNGAAVPGVSGQSARVQNISASTLLDWNTDVLATGTNYLTPTTRYSGATPRAERSLPFSDNDPVFLAQTTANPPVQLVSPVYGGIHVRRLSGANSTLDVLSAVQLAHDGQHGGGAVNGARFTAIGQGGLPVDISTVFLWPKSAFALANPAAPLTLNSGTTLSADLLSWFSGGLSRELRFLVRDGTTYYVSEVVFGNTSGGVALDGFVNNPSSRWAAIPANGFVNGTDSFAQAIGDAATYTYAARTFTDVQAVGFVTRARSEYNRYGAFNRFTLRSVTDTTPYVAYDIAAPSSTIRDDSVELTASAIDADSANLTYTWTLVSAPAGGGATFVGGATSTAAAGGLASKRVTFTTNGTYQFSVSVSDGTTTRTSSTLTLTVNSSTLPNPSTPPAITTQPTNKTVTVGGSATFTAAVSGQPAPTLSWQRNTGSGWTAISGATSASLTITNATAASLADYRLVATNAAGTATSNVVTLLPTDVTANLAARYNFEGTGSLGLDTSGVATPLNATVTTASSGLVRATPSSPVAPNGQSVAQWTGTAGNYLLVAEPGAGADNLDGFTRFSLAVWLNPGTSGVTNIRGVVSKRLGFTSDSAYALSLNSGKLVVDVGNTRYTAATALSSTAWSHVAVVFDGTLTSAQRIKIYVNGALLTTVSTTIAQLPSSSASFVVGALQSTTNNVPSYGSTYVGQLDDLRVYKEKALTADEVAFVYETTQ